jgi:protein-S-isoprenylcysteine O-methyltransferase Ste14
MSATESQRLDHYGRRGIAVFLWSHVPVKATLAGVVLLLPAFFIGMWVMMANPYFECTMRIQDDRGQQVITSGPYRLVRHPGIPRRSFQR